MRGFTLAFAALALLAGSVRGDIVKDRLDHDDRSIVLVARPFGFESNGVLDIKVENWKVYLEEGITGYDKTKLGFFITTAEAEAQLQEDLQAGARPDAAAARARASSHVASSVFLGFSGTPWALSLFGARVHAACGAPRTRARRGR